MFDRIDYKSENAKLRKKIVDLQMEITHLNNRLLETDEENIDILKRLDSTPSDCKPGSYCEVCAFGDPYFRRGVLSAVVYLCKKGKSCTNFIPKSEVKNNALLLISLGITRIDNFCRRSLWLNDIIKYIRHKDFKYGFCVTVCLFVASILFLAKNIFT